MAEIAVSNTNSGQPHEHDEHCCKHEQQQEAQQKEASTNDSTGSFCIPSFKASAIYKDYLEFIEELNASVVNVKTRAESEMTPVIERLVALLDELQQWCEEIKPDEHRTRFGNPAFRIWYDRLVERMPQLLENIVETDAIPEVGRYLQESFGNRERIDYGTGHEANFMAFLLCLVKLNLIEKTHYQAVVLCVFFKYIEVMRHLQFTYWLEPAGSHGVWGLDDYHFLPFLFGSAQLRDHPHFRPKSIHDADILDEFYKDYIYFACIRFINSVKTESLRWHSPMLDDISGVKTWVKVNQGMRKMYEAEVLGKLPIMQHFMFGSLLAFNEGSEQAEDEAVCGTHSHVHALGQETPICCGIRIPAAFGASESSESSSSTMRAPRRLPFD
ncbi:Phosphotyrosyl phosphatase activator [Syncephalis plumigaleata]|nr:Phosphotyrosyl phosphatase activator [Syncephalis plumigaleata]